MSDTTANTAVPEGKAPADAQARVDTLIREHELGLDIDQSVYMIALLANRSAAELHRLAALVLDLAELDKATPGGGASNGGGGAQN